MLKHYLIILVARCCWMLLCYTQCRVQKLHATIHSSVSAHTLQASSCLPPSQIAGLTNFGMLVLGRTAVRKQHEHRPSFLTSQQHSSGSYPGKITRTYIPLPKLKTRS